MFQISVNIVITDRMKVHWRYLVYVSNLWEEIRPLCQI